MMLIIAMLLAAADWQPALDALEDKLEWSEADNARAHDLAKITQREWQKCIDRAGAKFQNAKNEPADIIATATLGACSSEQGVYRRSLALAFRSVLEPWDTIKRADELVARYRARVREEIIADVLAARLSSN